MKTNLTLSVPKPCTEKWSTFSPTATGALCSSCSKTVLDFTTLSEEEVVNFFRDKPAHTCGRFRPDQLREYKTVMPFTKIKPGLTLFRAGVISLVLMLMSKQTSAETFPAHPTLGFVVLTPSAAESVARAQLLKPFANGTGTIKGIVKDEYGNLLPGINVVLKGTTTGTVTDVEGRYELHGDIKEGDVVVFTFIGLETQEYKIPKTFTGLLDLVMITMNMDITGEVVVTGPYEPQPTGLRKWWKKFSDLF